MRSGWQLIGSLTLMAVSSSAQADVSVAQFQQALQDPRSRETIETYVAGVGRGMIVFNADLGARRVFCVGEAAKLNASNFTDMVVEAARAAPPDALVEAILLSELKRRYPCR